MFCNPYLPLLFLHTPTPTHTPPRYSLLRQPHHNKGFLAQGILYYGCHIILRILCPIISFITINRFMSQVAAFFRCLVGKWLGITTEWLVAVFRIVFSSVFRIHFGFTRRRKIKSKHCYRSQRHPSHIVASRSIYGDDVCDGGWLS